MKPTGEAASGTASRTVRIGITGPIGCGKSTVAGWLGELGAVVIDADRVARQVTEPGTPALYQIISTFGEDLIRDDGTLDRAALGRIVFSNPAALAALEAIVHPAVRPVILAEMEAAAASGAPAVVVEAIKLVEGGLAELCDEVWLITCSPDAQRARVAARAMARGMDPADADPRIAAQAGLVERLTPHATRVVDASNDPTTTRVAVESAFAEVLSRRAAPTPAASFLDVRASTSDEATTGRHETNTTLNPTNTSLDQTNTSLDQTNTSLAQTNTSLDQTNTSLD